ncbi:MAG: ATP-binding protein [Acidimicrobiia bacterium]|nr:ATP-binding protein [Acidimicrobiia bacterium]
MTAAIRSEPRLGRFTAARVSPPTRRSLLKGLLAYRWLTLAWALGVFSWEVWWRHRYDWAESVAHPFVGLALGGAAVALTASLTALYQIDPDLLLRPLPVIAEIAIGTVMLLADTWIFGSTDHPQTLPSVWVVGAVASVAIAGGRRAAVVTGAGMGLARYVGLVPIAGVTESAFRGLSTMVLLAVSGWVIGYMLRRLAETDRFISAYRAREEVARTLHDGVLQTLAVIQRRSDDAELVALARGQEHELREYLFGTASVDADLASGLRAAAHRAEERYGLRVQVVVAPDLPAGSEDVIHRVTGAVGEALTNAAKHGEAATATVYAEPTDHGSIFLSVKDDGRGFDADQMIEGEGVSRSIRGRMAEIGGRVEIDGRPGRGTEVRMWV